MTPQATPGPEQADPHAPRHVQHPTARMRMNSCPHVSTSETGPGSCLDLLNHTIADATRTANAAVIVTVVAKSVARVVLSAGVVLAVIVTVAGLLTHFINLGQAVGGVVAIGGAAAVVGARCLRNRNIGRRKVASEESYLDRW
jgi:hypothetical protein